METAENRHLPLEQTSNHGNSTSNVEEPLNSPRPACRTTSAGVRHKDAKNLLFARFAHEIPLCSFVSSCLRGDSFWFSVPLRLCGESFFPPQVRNVGVGALADRDTALIRSCRGSGPGTGYRPRRSSAGRRRAGARPGRRAPRPCGSICPWGVRCRAGAACSRATAPG